MDAIFPFCAEAAHINANGISPHYFYRDRLNETFLKTELSTSEGEKVVVRDHSELKIHEINPDNCSAPYHLTVCALNLAGSWRLQNKDRQSRHFLFSKHYTGSKTTGYAETRKYRTKQRNEETNKEEFGLTKYSRAIAISGAAFASAVGHVSFFALTFLMTILNVRLGLWMVTPKKYKNKTSKADPMLSTELHDLRAAKSFFSPFWLSYLWDEATNNVSERRDLINISDGGHTGDNGAIYPLLERRCKLIIVGDASADPKGSCTDLYRAIRMARTDLGVDVIIDTDNLEPDKKTGLSKKHYAIGKIFYPEADGSKGFTGWLVYLKPTITKADRGEIKGYYASHPKMYPHPTTADQWFDEWQFEAQRLLGEESAKVMLTEWLGIIKGKQDKSSKDREDKSLEENLKKISESLFNKPDFDKRFKELMEKASLHQEDITASQDEKED